MPTLYILGGANGVGKTTWYHTGIHQGYISTELPFINVDNIAIKELGGYLDRNLPKAEEIARERMRSFILKETDFLIESNLARSSDYDWIGAMRKQGYDTSLFFLSTNDVAINKMRVQQRVREGGHDIAASIIEHRYSMGLSYLKSKVLDFNEARLIDVSTNLPREMASLQFGKIIFQHTELEPWAKDILHIAQRLAKKKKTME